MLIRLRAAATSMFLVAGLWPGSAAVPAEGGAAIDAAAAARAWAERQAACDHDGGALWRTSVCGPQIFVDPQTRAVVATRDSPSLHASLRDGVYAGTLPASMPIANTAFTMDGERWSMVVWPLPNDPVERRILVLHESWHRIQGALGLPAANPANDHLDSADGRFWLELEWRALARAVVAAGAARRAAVVDALAFRARRFASFPGAATSENALMTNEGLAEDTGIAMSTPPADRAVRVVERLLSGRQRTTFVRSFAYASGPAYGALLDAASPGWRRGLRGGADLGALLARAYGVHADAAVAPSRVAAYDDGALRLAEDARSARIATRVAQYRATFVDGPVLRIPLRDARYSFNPNLVTPVPGAGSVYGDFDLRGWFGELSAPDGALLTPDFTAAVVAAPPNASTTTTAAWTLTLAPGCALKRDARAGDLTIGCTP